MGWHKLAAAGVTVAAAATAGSLMAGGVGSAATSRPAPRQQAPRIAAPQPTKAAIAAVSPDNAPTINKMYLQVSGINGDETTPGYAGAIDAYSESWGVSNPVGGTGKPDLSSLSLQTAYDKAEPLLEHAAEVASIIPTVTFTEVNSTAGKVRQIVLTNAHIDSVSMGSAAGGDGGSVSLSFAFEQRNITYYYKDANGASHHTTSCYNVVNDNACTG